MNATTAIESGATSIRPGIQSGVADVVKFGIRLKSWFGIDLAAGTSTIDAVITLRWDDARAPKLLPPNVSSLTLSSEDAKTKMWLPSIAVTNRAHDGDDLISSSVQITKGGQVTKIDRLLLTLIQGFDTKAFPFDTQNVTIKVASTKYMLDELQLQPLQNASEQGASTEIFSNSVWSFQGAEMQSSVEEDGTLKKSRGFLILKVKRSPSQYLSSIFIPSVVLLFMTWSALWLPLGGPYTMPRVALNAFALLCQMSLDQTANRMVPATGKLSWMVEYIELCFRLQFALMVINVLIISIDYTKGGKELALSLNTGISRAYLVACAINIGVLYFVNSDYVHQALIIITIVGLLSYALEIYHRSLQPKDCEDSGPASPASPAS
jgi:hypothetical protein